MNKIRLFLIVTALLAMGSFAFADLVVDMEITKIGTTTIAGSGGGGSSHATPVEPAGWTGVITLKIYAKVTNGVVGYTAANGTNSLLLQTLGGNVTETSAGVHGDMGYLATTIYQNPFATNLSPDLISSGGDLQMIGTQNPWVARAGSPTEVSTGAAEGMDGGEPNPAVPIWTTLGTFTYTVKAGSGGTSSLNFNTLLTQAGALYGMGNYEDGDYHYFNGNSGGITATVPVTVSVAVPEPSTLILLGMGLLSLLAIRRRK